MASLTTLYRLIFYMIAQMVGAGTLALPTVAGTERPHGGQLRRGADGGLRRLRRNARDDMGGNHQGGPPDERHLFLSVLVMKHFGLQLTEFFKPVTMVTYERETETDVTKKFLNPGLLFGNRLYQVLGLGPRLRTAGPPHILFASTPCPMRDRARPRWAMVIIGPLHHDHFPRLRRATILRPDI